MNSEDIRRDQQRQGRAFSNREEGSPRPRGKSSGKKPQGHEAHLKMLEASKAVIRITLLDGSDVTGVVRHSDSYTISIKPEGKGTIVYFKHGIESFEPLDPAPARTTEEQQ